MRKNISIVNKKRQNSVSNKTVTDKPKIKKPIPDYKKVSKAARKGYLTESSLKKMGLDIRYQPAVVSVAEKIQRADIVIGKVGAPGKFVSKWGRRIIILSGGIVGIRMHDVIKEIQKTNQLTKELNKRNQQVNPGAKDVKFTLVEKTSKAWENTEFRIAIPDPTKREPIKQYLQSSGGAMVSGFIATAVLMVFVRNKLRNAINNSRAKNALKKYPPEPFK